MDNTETWLDRLDNNTNLSYLITAVATPHIKTHPTKGYQCPNCLQWIPYDPNLEVVCGCAVCHIYLHLKHCDWFKKIQHYVTLR